MQQLAKTAMQSMANYDGAAAEAKQEAYRKDLLATMAQGHIAPADREKMMEAAVSAKRLAANMNEIIAPAIKRQKDAQSDAASLKDLNMGALCAKPALQLSTPVVEALQNFVSSEPILMAVDLTSNFAHFFCSFSLVGAAQGALFHRHGRDDRSHGQ